MKEKRILTVQDVSCVGQCSLTVALPILSACGIETCVLPTAMLSTHTAFKHFTSFDLTAEMPKIREVWEEENIKFNALYTGYLGSAGQVGEVLEIAKTCLPSDAVKIVDPAMADFGRLYPAFDSDFVTAMRKLCSSADIILPNLTEACFLAGAEYRETYDGQYTDDILKRLHAATGVGTIVLTGIGYRPDKTGVLVYENGNTDYYEHDRIGRGCHGTGDVYASVFTGAYLHGKTVTESARISADFTVLCIKNTLDDPSHWYGVNFEEKLPELWKLLGK